MAFCVVAGKLKERLDCNAVPFRDSILLAFIGSLVLPEAPSPFLVPQPAAIQDGLRHHSLPFHLLLSRCPPPSISRRNGHGGVFGESKSKRT